MMTAEANEEREQVRQQGRQASPLRQRQAQHQGGEGDRRQNLQIIGPVGALDRAGDHQHRRGQQEERHPPFAQFETFHRRLSLVVYVSSVT